MQKNKIMIWGLCPFTVTYAKNCIQIGYNMIEIESLPLHKIWNLKRYKTQQGIDNALAWLRYRL